MTNFGNFNIGQVEEVSGKDSVFVGRLALLSDEPPIDDQISPFKNSQDRIRVSNINDE
jgi:hypothetical protein